MLRIRKSIKIPIKCPAIGILLVMVLAIALSAAIPALAKGSVGQTSLGWKNQEHKQEWNDGNYGEYPEGGYWQCQITMDNGTDAAIDITEFGIAFDFWQTSGHPTGGAVGVDWTRNWAWTMTPSDFFVKKQADPRYPYTGDPLSPTWSGDWTPFTPAIWNMPYDPGTNWYTTTESCGSPALSHFYSHFCDTESGSGIPNLLPAHTSLAIYCEPHLALTYLWNSGLGGTLPIDGVYDGTPYVRDWTCHWGGAGYFSGSSMHGIIVYSGSKTFQLPSGVIVSGSVSGYKYDDKDGSGTLTAGDVGIANWPIALNGTVEGFPVGPVLTVTDSNGYYEFLDLPEGSGPYCVQEAPDNGYPVPYGYEGYSHTSPSELCDIYASSADNDFFNVGCGEVSITKTASPSPLGCPGETITYTLTVSNAGPGTATGIYLEDTLPTNMALTDVKLNGGSTGDYIISGGVLRYPATGGVSLDAGESFILTIEGTATDCDPLENSVTVYADNDCSEAGNTANTNTNRNIPPIVSSLISDGGIGSCESQGTVNADYLAWHSALSFSGGCNRVDNIVKPPAPDHCGGQATVTWNITSDCEDPIVGSATYTVADAPAVYLNVPADKSDAACTYANQTAVDAAFSTWLGQVTWGGGCNAAISNNNTGAPDFCGGTTTVEWTVTSDCEDDVKDSATFTVGTPASVYLNVPADKSDAACTYANQTAVDVAFSTWLGQVTWGGGCNAAISNNNTGAPDFCGGTTTVEWTVTSDCEDDVKDSATFTVGTPDSLNVTCSDDYVGFGETCSTDPEITGSPIVSGGCDPQVTYEDDFTPEPGSCGWTVTRTWNITDLCESHTCTQNISCTCPPTCETAVAAQGPGPGQYRFLFARNWFTYIKYEATGPSGGPVEYPIFAGQTFRIGTLYVQHVDKGGGVSHLQVRYLADVAPPVGCTWDGFNVYHIEVVDEWLQFYLPDSIVKNWNPAPGQCEYSGPVDPIDTDTGYIELPENIKAYGDDDVYIFAHSVFCYYCD